MAGFSEFLINNMKSSLEPEDLKLFSRNPKLTGITHNESNDPTINDCTKDQNKGIKNYIINNVADKKERGYEVFDESESDITDESDSSLYQFNENEHTDEEKNDQYVQVNRPKLLMRQQNNQMYNETGELNGYSRYRIISDKLKQSVKKKSNKVNTVKSVNKNKNMKNLTYDKSWKNLANKYDVTNEALEVNHSKTVKSPEGMFKTLVNRTLEKTKTIAIHHEKEKTLKFEASPNDSCMAPKVSDPNHMQSHVTICLSSPNLNHASIDDSEETTPNASKKITNNPIYISDSKIKKDSDKELSSNDHQILNKKFSNININDLKPINASFSQIDNIDSKFNEIALMSNKSKENNEENNYDKLKYNEANHLDEIKAKTNKSNAKSLQHTVKFEINQLLVENNCTLLKDDRNEHVQKNDDQNYCNEDSDDDDDDDDFGLEENIKELHTNSALFKALKILKIVFNKQNKPKALANEANAASVRFKKRKKKLPSINGTIRINGKITHKISTKRKNMLLKKKVKNGSSSSFTSSKIKRNKTTNSNNGSKSKVNSKKIANMKEKYEDDNIYSNNLTLQCVDNNKTHFKLDKSSTNSSEIKNSQQKVKNESNYKYRSKLNNANINLAPFTDQISNPRNFNNNIKNTSSSASSMANSNISSNLEKCKLKNKERLLSNWDKVIKKASNDPQSLKQLLKNNNEKAIEDSKKLKSNDSKQEVGSKSNTSLLLKLNNKLNVKNNKKVDEKNKLTQESPMKKNEKCADNDSNIFDKNTEKMIDEMLVNAKTAGKQGELVKNLFSYLNNYGDDGFTIKANNNHLVSPCTPLFKSELISQNQLSSTSSSEHLSDKKISNGAKKPLKPIKKNYNCSSNVETNQVTSDSLLTASSATSFGLKVNLCPNTIVTSPKVTKPPQAVNPKNQKSSNFPYYLKCCVDKNTGSGSTIGSRCSTVNNGAKTCTTQQNLDMNNSTTYKESINKNYVPLQITPKEKDTNRLLDIDQLIQTLEGDGQVEFFKKKLSLYIKSKNIINSTSTIEDYSAKPSTASTASFNKKEISHEIVSKNNLSNENTMNDNTYNLTITEKTNLNDNEIDSKLLAANDNTKRGSSPKNIKNSLNEKEIIYETKVNSKNNTQQNFEPSTLESLAISSTENFSTSTITTLNSPSFTITQKTFPDISKSTSKIDNLNNFSINKSETIKPCKNINITDMPEVKTNISPIIKVENFKQKPTAQKVDNKLMNNLKQKEAEVEMFYFDAIESPTRKTLMKNKTEKFIKGFYKHLTTNSSTPNPETFLQSENENHSTTNQTLSKFYFSPDTNKNNSSDFQTRKELKPLLAENDSPKPSFQYQHQNIFKTILRSKHFQTLRRTCDACQNPKNNCICGETPALVAEIDIAANNLNGHEKPSLNKDADVDYSNGVDSESLEFKKPIEITKEIPKNKTKLQKLIHEFYSPIITHNEVIDSNKKVKSKMNQENNDKDQNTSKHKTFNQIKCRTKEKLKNQMKEWGLSFNIGTTPSIDDGTSMSAKTIKSQNRAHFEDDQKINIRLRSRVKKQLKQYETNSIVGTKKRRSKRIEWRPLVGDQIPKSSKQILQEISVIAKNKAAKKNPQTMNLKNKPTVKNSTHLIPRSHDNLIETKSTTVNNDNKSSSNQLYRVSNAKKLTKSSNLSVDQKKTEIISKTKSDNALNDHTKLQFSNKNNKYRNNFTEIQKQK